MVEKCPDTSFKIAWVKWSKTVVTPPAPLFTSWWESQLIKMYSECDMTHISVMWYIWNVQTQIMFYRNLQSQLLNHWLRNRLNLKMMPLYDLHKQISQSARGQFIYIFILKACHWGWVPAKSDKIIFGMQTRRIMFTFSQTMFCCE